QKANKSFSIVISYQKKKTLEQNQSRNGLENPQTSVPTAWRHTSNSVFLSWPFFFHIAGWELKGGDQLFRCGAVKTVAALKALVIVAQAASAKTPGVLAQLITFLLANPYIQLAS
ncbi:hypothetical protein Tsubulata_031539, partial [Turnera subulata]